MGAGVEVSDNFIKDQDEEGYPYYFYIMPGIYLNLYFKINLNLNIENRKKIVYYN